MSPVRLTATVASLVLLAAGCSFSDSATPVPTPSSPAPSSAAPATPVQCSNPLASYAPPSTMPTPGDMPAGSTMRTIQDRGRLVVGVSADTLLMGARDPISGRIVGFDIDLANAVARAIFGEDGHLELRVITAADRIPLLQEGEVDMVARNMTINCERWEQIAFSTEYYAAGQKILVPADSRARSLDDLAGDRVCAPFASTSLARLDEYPDVVPVGSATHTGCLVLFQQGQVDAITGDDTVLAGLAAQDPYAFVPPQQRAVSAEPYGLGFNSEDVDLVRFANGVLEDIRTDGRWQEFYGRWLADALNTRGNLPSPPQPEYGR